MSESINVMIENSESVESIYTLAKDINEEAQVFKKNTNKLRNRLRCRVYKVRKERKYNCSLLLLNALIVYLQWNIIIALIIILILGAIVACVYFLSGMGKKGK